jgi:hypothetical protein
MSKIIFHDFATAPDVPTAGQTMLYTMGGEAHVLAPDGTDVTIRSAQLPVTRIEALAGGSNVSNDSTWRTVGSGITFVATTDKYLVMLSFGFLLTANESGFIGVRVNGVDTVFNAYMAGQITNAFVLSTVMGTTYTIRAIIRNNSNLSPQTTVGGFLMVQETAVP